MNHYILNRTEILFVLNQPYREMIHDNLIFQRRWENDTFGHPGWKNRIDNWNGVSKRRNSFTNDHVKNIQLSTTIRRFTNLPHRTGILIVLGI